MRLLEHAARITSWSAGVGFLLTLVALCAPNRAFAQGVAEFYRGKTEGVRGAGLGLGADHDGGYAEFGRFPADWVIPLPAGLTLFEASALGVAGHRLVHGVIQQLGHQMVHGALVGAADIHAGPAAHRLQPLQDLDVLGGIV